MPYEGTSFVEIAEIQNLNWIMYFFQKKCKVFVGSK